MQSAAASTVSKPHSTGNTHPARAQGPRLQPTLLPHTPTDNPLNPRPSSPRTCHPLTPPPTSTPNSPQHPPHALIDLIRQLGQLVAEGHKRVAAQLLVRSRQTRPARHQRLVQAPDLRVHRLSKWRVAAVDLQRFQKRS